MDECKPLPLFRFNGASAAAETGQAGGGGEGGGRRRGHAAAMADLNAAMTRRAPIHYAVNGVDKPAGRVASQPTHHVKNKATFL